MKEKPSFITKEEIEYLDNYLEVIGGSDVKTQLSILDKTEETLSDNLNKSKLDEKRCNGAPDFILEIVSPGNAADDYIRKLYY